MSGRPIAPGPIVPPTTAVSRTLLIQATQPLMLTTGLGFSANGASLVVAADYSAMRTLLGLGSVALLTSDTDGTLAANSDSRVATQKAVKTYVDASVVGLLEDKGNQDCSANPNYPAASKGDVYTVSVAGKIGGGSGITVEVGDVFRATADNAGGTQASVGSSWAVVQANLVGALVSGGALGTPSSGTLTNCTGLPVGGVTGITAAAQTVLDDTTVADMVNTLGGATSTGTGGLVRSADPILTGLVGINCTPNAAFAFDLQGYFRAHDSSGRGIEFQGGATCYLSAYDRASPVYLPIEVTGTTVTLQPSGSMSGLRVAATGDVLIGTLTGPTANRGKVLVLGDNGATDPTLGASTCAVYQKSGELYHMDASGNVTLTSPHAIDEAMAAGLDIPDDDMHPSIGKSYNVYSGHGTYTYRDQIVPFQIPVEKRQDWTESQLAAALAREQERFQYEVAKALHNQKQTAEPFEQVKPRDYVPVDPPLWLQKRGVPTVDRPRLDAQVKLRKQDLTDEVKTYVDQILAEEAAEKQRREEAAGKNVGGERKERTR